MFLSVESIRRNPASDGYVQGLMECAAVAAKLGQRCAGVVHAPPNACLDSILIHWHMLLF